MILNTVIREVLTRSYACQTIQSQTSPTWAILIPTLIFMLYHAAGILGAWLPGINVFLAGILFGVAYYLTGNLWLLIAIHFIWNFLLGPVLGLAVSGQDEANSWHLFALQCHALFTGGAFGIEGGMDTCTNGFRRFPCSITTQLFVIDFLRKSCVPQRSQRK